MDPQAPPEGAIDKPRQGRLWPPLAAVFLGSFAFFAAVFFALPVLYDTDSYYHLAIGRAFAQHGLPSDLPWARFSLMAEGFGDKEVLFHLLLAPFALFGTAGGRLALALLNAAIATLLAGFGLRLLGRIGLLLPLIVYFGSADFWGRAIRLRPELLALLLLLLFVWMAAGRRWRWTAAIAFAFTLGYTAFHALLGLAFLFFVAELWKERRAEWPALLYPGLGCGLGLVLHPHFPHNLVIWKVQSFDFFGNKAHLDVGLEIGAARTDALLLQGLPFALAMVCLWRSARPAADGERSCAADATATRRLELLAITAAVFSLLYLLMQRFSTYAIPFAALTVAAAVAARGGAGRRIRLPWRGSLSIVLGLGLALLPGIVQTARQVRPMAQEPGPVGRELEWAAFGRAVPPGAKVAAEWGIAAVYLYFAPQALYLNFLDPVFMALPYPDAYETQRALFDGREADPAQALKAELDSDFIAFSRFHREPRLAERLDADPRFERIYQGYNLLYRLAPGKNGEFLLDWRLVPPGTALPPPASAPAEGWPAYPRREVPEERALEAFVDLRRIPTLDRRGCAALVHTLVEPVGRDGGLEIAPAGPTRIWLDERPLAALDDDLGAQLGRGLTLALRLEAGHHLLTVVTCPPRDVARSRAGGFYLRLR